jgi:hypothetical protein
MNRNTKIEARIDRTTHATVTAKRCFEWANWRELPMNDPWSKYRL